MALSFLFSLSLLIKGESSKLKVIKILAHNVIRERELIRVVLAPILAVAIDKSPPCHFRQTFVWHIFRLARQKATDTCIFKM